MEELGQSAALAEVGGEIDTSSWWLSWYPQPPGNTRERILYHAFREAHLNGFQAASIQSIIDAAGVTKGALYHYFASKEEIGIALLDEIFSQYIQVNYIDPFCNTDDPIQQLLEYLQQTATRMSGQDIALGCPMDRFSQEMAPLNLAYQQKIDALYQRKHEALVSSLKRGQRAGNVTKDLTAESIALMINATLQGCMAMAKTTRSLDTLMQCGAGLFHYLEQLRPDKSRQ